MRNFSEGLALTIGLFQKVQCEVIYFPYVWEWEKWEAAVNCPNIAAYSVKIVKFLVRIISEPPWKAISLMFETETFGPCLVWKLNYRRKGIGGWHYPLVIPVVTPLNIVTEKFKSGVICHNSFEHCHSTFENYIFCKFWFSRLVD